MAMNVSVGGDEDEDQVNSTINTTPLVDVMLVLLIIFLITIPVVTHTVPVQLPHETNVATKTKPQNIVIAVDQQGNIYWNNAKLADFNTLLTDLKQHAGDNPQPEVHIRGDRNSNFEFVGKVFLMAERAGIQKVAFITEPEHGSAVQ